MGAGKSTAAQPLLPAVGMGNRAAVREYLTYLLKHEPDKFEQYFTDLFLSPTSPMSAERNSVYQKYTAYMQEREGVSKYLSTTDPTRVPETADTINEVRAGIQRILQAFQQLMELDKTLDLLFTLNATLAYFRAMMLMHQRHRQNVPADLVASVQQVQFMSGAVNAVGALLPLVTAVGSMLKKLDAFATLKQTGVTDAKALSTFWQSAQLSPLDRSPIATIRPPYDTLVTLETQLCNYFDAMIQAWQPETVAAAVAAAKPRKVGKLAYPHQFFKRTGGQGTLLQRAQANELTFETAKQYINTLIQQYEESEAKYMELQGHVNKKIVQAHEKSRAAYEKLESESNDGAALEFVTNTANWLSLIYATYGRSSPPNEYTWADLLVLCSWYAMVLRMTPIHLTLQKLAATSFSYHILSVAFQRFVNKFTEAYLTNQLAEFVDAENKKLAFRFSAAMDEDDNKQSVAQIKLMPVYAKFMKTVAKNA